MKKTILFYFILSIISLNLYASQNFNIIAQAQKYPLEIAAFFAIIALLIIYRLIKKNKDENLYKGVNKNNTAQIIYDEYEPKEDKRKNIFKREIKNETKEKIKDQLQNEIEDLEEYDKEEEFVVEEHHTNAININALNQAENFEEEPEPIQTRRKYRDVPEHAKIEKSSFSIFSQDIKVLVADDNQINQKVIQGLLSQSKIQITLANNGQEALEILKKNSDFNIVLMDARMPVIDGFEATRRIRNNPNYEHILVIGISGDVGQDDIRKMKEAGMEEFLEKPIQIDKLYDLLYAYSPSDPHVEQKTTHQETKQEQTPNLQEIKEKQLDIQKGLEVCGDDVDFYHEILNEFINLYANSASLLKEHLTTNNLDEADRYLLDIIGVTSNIGAISLHQIAIDFKEAIQQKKIELFSPILKDYERYLQATLKDIKEELS